MLYGIYDIIIIKKTNTDAKYTTQTKTPIPSRFQNSDTPQATQTEMRFVLPASVWGYSSGGSCADAQ
jgi:hypothetical protein